ncbi:MAG: pyridoxamine 5'-phosphate oxidase family protein [Pseudomonadota bacterium]
MSNAYHDIAFTDAVKARQEARGSRASYAGHAEGPVHADAIGPAEAAFIAQRDSVYLASVGETGWPYVQHRGGPRGFIRVLDARTLGFAEFRGNKQYVTTGNIDGDDRVSFFFMDYANRRRLKLYGHARRVEIDAAPDLAAPYAGTRLEPRIEGALLIKVAALDWNCPQYITPRFTEEEIAALVAQSQTDPGGPS